LAALRAHQERQIFTRVQTEAIFCTAAGQPLDRTTTLREFYALLKSAGLPHVRFHDLRHTCASLLLQAGVHPKVVQERLGHASISMTLDTYSHTVPAMQEAAADALDARIGVKQLSTALE
jgi:integrase